MYNDYFYEIVQRLLLDIRNLCNKLNDLENKCNMLAALHEESNPKLAFQWKKNYNNVSKCKIAYSLIIIKLRKISDIYLEEDYYDELMLSKKISYVTSELEKLKEQYDDLFN